ncbi:MAG: hypothetical protein B6245_14245 [Desulfobacteraceae bacterium 4572_88]|nr:MAG: hypothetical protein B6245_14245 [Desulfobacteraceae bacterium 4572_88]
MLSSESVLYYALGGGLGHITRTLAILNHIEHPDSFRILASGRWAHLAEPYSPVPIDRVPKSCMNSRSDYGAFLEDYIRRHGVRQIVLDTFPFGIVGEWRGQFPEISRFLVARYLKWQDYLKRIALPRKELADENLANTLIIEPQAPAYEAFLSRKSRTTFLYDPIVFAGHDLRTRTPGQETAWLVVHSGDRKEQDALLSFANEKRKQMGHENTILDTVFPNQGIYPAQKIMGNYSHIVSAAGRPWPFTPMTSVAIS